jgi:hypothetical protein
MQLQAAIAAGIVEPPKRARTRPPITGEDEGGTAETPTGLNVGPRAPVRSLPDGLSEEQLDSILTAISCGVTFEAALASVRVPRTSMHVWMERNDELRALIEDARESWARAHVEFIAQSADWKARSWLLGVRLPKQYAATNKLAGHDGGALLADAELLELARRALGVVPPDGDAGED